MARLAELREGRGRRVRARGREIALWRVGGRVYAVGNVCAHQHVSAIHDGMLEGLAVVCPMHGWTYSLETGRATSGSGRIPVYAVKIDGEQVLVEVPREEEA